MAPPWGMNLNGEDTSHIEKSFLATWKVINEQQPGGLRPSRDYWEGTNLFSDTVL